MKNCPYCAEPIQDTAVKCRYCGSSLQRSAVTREWYRSRRGKKIAGVCAGLGDVDAAVLVDRHRMRRLELAVAGAARSPHQQELAVLVELRDARVAVAVAHEERTVGQPRDVGRPFEMRAVVARLVALAERHQQLLAVVADLPDLMMDVVDEPDAVFRIVGAD